MVTTKKKLPTSILRETCRCDTTQVRRACDTDTASVSGPTRLLLDLIACIFELQMLLVRARDRRCCSSKQERKKSHQSASGFDSCRSGLALGRTDRQNGRQADRQQADRQTHTLPHQHTNRETTAIVRIGNWHFLKPNRA